MQTPTNLTAAVLVSAVASLAGANTGLSDTTPSTATVLGLAQRASMDRSFAWLERDAAVRAQPITVTTFFREVPGSMERNGRLAARVKTRAQMAEQIARTGDANLVNANLPVGARGVAAAQGGNQDLGIDTLLRAAETRMEEARARLAPSLIEAHMDVDVHTFVLPEGLTEEQVAAALMATGDYEYVEPDWLVYPTENPPNDPLYGNQWHHRAQHIDTVNAWDLVTGGSDIIVAVCDTGVDQDHPDLTLSLVPGFNSVNNLAQVDGGFVDDNLNGHGTRVAGCMAARGNNGTGVAGVGWGFGIMPIRVSNNSDGTASISDILQGARWASDNGAYAVNASYGGSSSSQANSSGTHIRAEGHLLVFSSGNDGIQDQTNDWANVTIVGASNQSSNVAGFSNYGVGIDVVAPGVSIWSTTRTGGYGSTQGTSFASPITAATLALIHAANPALTATEVEQTLFNTAIDVGALGEDIFAGNGRIDAADAVNQAIFGPDQVDLPFADSFGSDTLSNVWKNPVGTIEVNALASGLEPGDHAMELDGTDSIMTPELRAASIGLELGEASFRTQHQGTESGESLLVEFFSLLGTWETLTTVASDGVDQDEFVLHRIELPFTAKHEGLRIRFTAQGTDGSDNWFVDDVLVQQFEGNTMPWVSGFEPEIALAFDWSAFGGTQTTEEAQQGSSSAKLTGSDEITSNPVEIVTATGNVYVRVRSLASGVETGENLEVEYFSALGSWSALGTIEPTSSWALNQYTLPFAAFGADFAVRVRATGDSADDVWYIDDVAVSEELLEEETPCPADLAEPAGVLNFFDLGAFLTLFNAQDPAADFAAPTGVFNFFDLGEFLTQFNAGCP